MEKPKFSLARLGRLGSISNTFIRPIFIPLLVAVASLGLLGYHLLRLVPFGPSEQATQLGSATMSAIKNDILFGPLKGLQIALLKITENDIYMRLASVAVGVVAALLLYVMLRKWYTARVSVLTVIMFMCSSWFLHQGRLANLDVLYLTAVPALLVACMLLISKRHNKMLPIAALLVGVTLYVPAAWLFIVFAIVALRKIVPKAFAVISTRLKLISGGVLLLTLIPLLYSFALKPSQITRWLGLDTSQEFTAQAIGSNFLEIPRQLFLSGPNDAARWLVGTPILDLFTVAMVVLGLYAYRTGYYASREKLTFGSIVIAVLVIGFGNVATLSLLIPLLYLAAANGLAYMLQSWFTVFPRNPVARSVGISLLVIVIAGSCFYQLHRYFVAWPKAENTTKALMAER